MIDVEQRALRALEQDSLAFAPLDVEQPPYGFGIGQKLRCQHCQIPQDLFAVDLCQIEPAAQRIVMRQQPIDLVRQRIEIGEIHQADRAPAHLVLVGGADAAPRGADRGAGVRRLPKRIEFAV